MVMYCYAQTTFVYYYHYFCVKILFYKCGASEDCITLVGPTHWVASLCFLTPSSEQSGLLATFGSLFFGSVSPGPSPRRYAFAITSR